MTVSVAFHDLKDQSVFITGGGSGIGAALTDSFLAQGAHVAFVQRSDATDFCATMQHRHGRAPLALRGDISSVETLRETLQNAANQQGPISILVNNAANDQRHKTEAVDEEFWDWSQAINLKAYFFACQAVIAGMRDKGGGAIINFSSISYMMGNPGYPIYAAANAAINGLTRCLAREFGSEGIRVNTIAPGSVMTPRQKRLWMTPEQVEKHLDRQCIPQSLVPEDITGTVLFLASNCSRMITGQTIVVDGGVVTTG